MKQKKELFYVSPTISVVKVYADYYFCASVNGTTGASVNGTTGSSLDTSDEEDMGENW